MDTFGSGHYHAPRGNRLHNGIDFIVIPKASVLSLACGKVTKIGYPYGDDLSFRYVQVTDKDGVDCRYFYVSPSVVVGDTVRRGVKVGIAQDLSTRYKGITPHIHFEVKRNNTFLEPVGYLESSVS